MRQPTIPNLFEPGTHYNPADSRQLSKLRQRFKAAHPTLRATAYKLGRFNALHHTPVTDYGAHSSRWIKLFEWGCSDRQP